MIRSTEVQASPDPMSTQAPAAEHRSILVLTGIHHRDFCVNGAGTITADIVGVLTVLPGAEIEIAGTVHGDVIVEREARVRVTGAVLGIVRNQHGGFVTIGRTGQLRHPVDHAGVSETELEFGSTIAGRVTAAPTSSTSTGGA